MDEIRTTRVLKLLSKALSWSITANDHRTSYETVFEYLKYGCCDETDELSQEEHERARESNTLFTCQVYPETPVGFFTVRSDTLSGMFEKLESVLVQYFNERSE